MAQESLEFDLEGIDFSVIRTAIKCGGTVLDQILNGIHYGTPEVRCLLLDECDLILECKVCRNMFRALPNFIAHKRIYCLDAYQDPFERVRIPVAQEESRNEEVVIVEPLAPEESAVIAGPVEQTGDVGKTVATTSGADTNGIRGSLEATIEQLKNGTFDGKSEAYKFYSNAADKVAEEQECKQTRYVRHDPIPGNSNAVRVSIVDEPPEDTVSIVDEPPEDTDCLITTHPSSENINDLDSRESPLDPDILKTNNEKATTVQPLVRSARIRAKTVPVKYEPEKSAKVPQIAKPPRKVPVSDSVIPSPVAATSIPATATPSPAVSATRMNLRDRAKKLFLSPIRRHLSERNDCDVKTLTCLKCKTKYSTTKSLQYHMNSYHANTRRVFPCSFCNSVFLHFWGLTRHVGRTHNKNKKQVAKLRENLKKLAYDKPIDNFTIGPGARLTILNDTEIAVVKADNAEKYGMKPPDMPVIKKEESVTRAKQRSPETKAGGEESTVERPRRSKPAVSCTEVSKETQNKSIAENNTSTEARASKNPSRRRREKITACTLISKRKTTASGRSVTGKLTSSKTAPQFSSGLSLLQCEVCGKAFAKKRSLESHFAQCNSRQENKGAEIQPDLPEPATRKSSRRRQMTVAKIEGMDEDDRKNEKTSHACPEKLVANSDEDNGMKGFDNLLEICDGQKDGILEQLECKEKQAKPIELSTPSLRKSNRRRQSSPMKIETRRRLSSPMKKEKNIGQFTCGDVLNPAEVAAAAGLDVEKQMETEDMCIGTAEGDNAHVSVSEEQTLSGEEMVALITDEELLLLQQRLEAQIDDQIVQVSQELLGSPSDDDSEKEVRLVEEIWVTKSPGQPTEKVKSNRVYVMDSRGRNSRRGRPRPHCQDTRKIDALIDENNLKCLHCHDLFGCVSNLRRHAIRHLGWKRYQCRLCRYSCYNKSECKSHLIRIHSSRTKSLSSACLDHCILDLTKEASKIRTQKKRQTLSSLNAVVAGDTSQTSPNYNTGRGNVRAQSLSPNRTCMSSRMEDRKKPAVSEVNITDPDPKRFNISTRNSPRVFDTRPCATVDTMRTLFTRKGYYLKYSDPSNAGNHSNAVIKKTGTRVERDLNVSHNKNTGADGTASKTPGGMTKKRFKTRSIDFRKPSNMDGAAIRNRYRRWSESRLENCQRELQKFERIGAQDDDDAASVVLEGETHPSKNVLDVIDLDGENESETGNVSQELTSSPKKKLQSDLSKGRAGHSSCGIAIPSPSCGSEASPSASELPDKPDSFSAGRDLSKTLATALGNEIGTNTI